MNAMNTITIEGKPVDVAKRKLVDRYGRSRKGNYMHMTNGLKYWPFDPRPDEIHIDVIAHQLATNCRWAGAVQHKKHEDRIFYSVAEHSVYCADYVIKVLKRPDLALEALLHDAPEYVIGDLIRPLKYDPSFAAYFEVEKVNDLAIAQRFDLVFPFSKEIKMADEAVCEAEAQQIIYRHPDEEWSSGLLHEQKACARIEIEMLLPYHAKEKFLVAYRGIMSERAQYRPLSAA